MELNADLVPVLDHSWGVDAAAKCGISIVDGHISIWSLLLQYTYTKSKKNQDRRTLGTFIGSADSELSTIQRFFRARVIATYKNFNCRPDSVIEGEKENSCNRQHTSTQIAA